MADKHEDENFIRPCTIPASPNWYCSCAGGCSDNGKYVFGGKNYLFLTDLENLICDSKLTQGYFAAHKERVTAVCLLPDVKEPLEGEYWSLVASGSDDMLVRIWGCETGQKLREHKRHQVSSKYEAKSHKSFFQRITQVQVQFYSSQLKGHNIQILIV